jgi:predicted nucleic acid-binding protein
MSFVVDASIAASWVLPDEGHPAASAAFSLLVDHDALVPSLWWFEVRNIFVICERRQRLTPQQTEQALGLLGRLPIVVDQQPNGNDVMALARRHRLTAYDAAYLELARREQLPLATLDAALLHAAKQEGVLLVGDGQQR